MARGRVNSTSEADEDRDIRSIRVAKREEQVLELAGRGHTDREISEMLDISRDTVGTYWRRLLNKFDASSRTEVVAKIAQRRAEDVLAELRRQNDVLQREVSARALAEARETAQRQHLEAIQISAVMMLDQKTQQAGFVRLLDELILVGRCTGAVLFECRNSTPGKAYFVAGSSYSDNGDAASESIKVPDLLAKLRVGLNPIPIPSDAAEQFRDYMAASSGHAMFAIPVVHGKHVLGFVLAAFSSESEIESNLQKCSSVLAFLSNALKFTETERRRATLEEMLEKASRRQKMLIDALPMGLLYENGKNEVEYISFPFLEMVGSNAHPRELIGSPVPEVLKEIVTDKNLLSLLTSMAASNDELRKETQPVGLDGPIEILRRPLVSADQSQGWMWCFRRL
jgi:DNA-binding CsgD family transcriptional regulator